MEFEPLHFKDKLTLVNPRGRVGLATLWSKPEYVLERLAGLGVDLSPATSPIAVVGTHYGSGLREMLRNLLYNPQIDHVLLFGRERSDSVRELMNFFEDGLEVLADSPVTYCLGEERIAPARIRGTGRIVDSLLTPEKFAAPPKVVHIGEADDPEAGQRFKEYLEALPAAVPTFPERLAVDLPESEAEVFPSNPRGHAIVAADAITAWEELVFRLHRYGQVVRLRKGERKELQNVKVVVEGRKLPTAARIAPYSWLSLPAIKDYRGQLLRQDLSPDETYNYGHRMRAYFGLDGLLTAAERLRADPQSRYCHVSLWDTGRDLAAASGHPCLVSVFFRTYQGRLTLTAVFRTHNAVDAWPVNFYGLAAVLEFVAERAGLPAGAVTIMSQSISIDTRDLVRARMVAEVWDKRGGITLDPCGNFVVTVDAAARELVVHHMHDGVLLKEYRARKAQKLEAMIARDRAVSDIGHAMYLGRELTRAEMCLKSGETFVQK